jgi:asparagine synthetase B (glutamine-hydrolysing)
MITYPKVWKRNYEDMMPINPIDNIDIPKIVDLLTQVVADMGVNHLAYSGGIDSTIMLCLMSKVYNNVSTYTISVREDHPDVKFARLGSSFYNSTHHEFLVRPTIIDPKFLVRPTITDPTQYGDDAVKQLFFKASSFTESMICCDGIDEFMCGYYKHIEQQNRLETYKWFLSRLLPGHLEPLNKNSGNVKVYLPYLDNDIVSIFSNIPLDKKVDSKNRKKVVCDIAKYLDLPESIISRNKYGFCDAFLKSDK